MEDISRDINKALAASLINSEPLLALDEILNKTDKTISESIRHIVKINNSLLEIGVNGIENKTRVLLHRGEKKLALRFLTENTGMNKSEAVEYIDILHSSLCIFIPLEIEKELVKLFCSGEKIQAVGKVRAIARTVGIDGAMKYLSLVSEEKISVVNRELYTDTQINLSDKINKYIEENYKKEDWKDIKWLLAFYGIESYEINEERVQLTILELAKGNTRKLPYLVHRAKGDWRDFMR